MSKEWTKEQHDERDRIMRESDLPDEPGYMGSRRMHADHMADTLYERRKSMERMAKDIVDEIISKPPDSLDDLYESNQILVKLIRDYPTLFRPEITDWVQQSQDILTDL